MDLKNVTLGGHKRHTLYHPVYVNRPKRQIQRDRTHISGCPWLGSLGRGRGMTDC